MNTTMVTIENWDGDGAIRLTSEVLRELGVEIGDTIYVLDGNAGGHHLCLVLSKTPQIPDRTDGMFD